MLTNYDSVAQNLKKVFGRLNSEFGILSEFFIDLHQKHCQFVLHTKMEQQIVY